MKEASAHFARNREERQKFGHFMHTLVWVKQKTGWPSGEIVNLLLRKSKEGVYQTFHDHYSSAV